MASTKHPGIVSPLILHPLAPDTNAGSPPQKSTILFLTLDHNPTVSPEIAFGEEGSRIGAFRKKGVSWENGV